MFFFLFSEATLEFPQKSDDRQNQNGRNRWVTKCHDQHHYYSKDDEFGGGEGCGVWCF
jgi:hypothetical protein